MQQISLADDTAAPIIIMLLICGQQQTPDTFLISMWKGFSKNQSWLLSVNVDIRFKKMPSFKSVSSLVIRVTNYVSLS